MGFLQKIFGIGSEVLSKILGKNEESRKAQTRLNEAEIAGAPQSALRLWRSALGWCLALAFVWEIVIRPVIQTYWPQASLPPSFMEEISGLLMTMLGMGL